MPVLQRHPRQHTGHHLHNPNSWRLDQLVAWEERRMAVAEAALDATPEGEDAPDALAALLPRPEEALSVCVAGRRVAASPRGTTASDPPCHQAYPSGADFDREGLVADAAYNFELFGYFGLSLWHVSEVWPLERIFDEKTHRARRIALFRAGEAPHYDTSHGPVYGESYANVQITSDSAEELVDRCLAAAC